MGEWRFPHSDHLSPSQVTEYLACPACFKLSRIDRVAKPMNVALPVGGAVHKAVEAMRRNRLDFKPSPVGGGQIQPEEFDSFVDYRDQFLTAAVDHFDESLEIDPETNGEVMLDLGEYKD